MVDNNQGQNNKPFDDVVELALHYGEMIDHLTEDINQARIRLSKLQTTNERLAEMLEHERTTTWYRKLWRNAAERMRGVRGNGRDGDK